MAESESYVLPEQKCSLPAGLVSVFHNILPLICSEYSGLHVLHGLSLIHPWDASVLKEIEKAINASDIGIAPQNDGKVIRLNFPPLTEERRKELVKTVKKYTEEAKVQIRNARRDAIDKYKAMKKDGEITEDDLKETEKDIQDLTDKYIKEIDNISAAKEKEILEV